MTGALAGKVALVTGASSGIGEALALVGDVTEEAFATRIVEQMASHFGRLDILFNSAGVI